MAIHPAVRFHATFSSCWFQCLQTEDSNPLKQDIKKDKLRHYPYNIHWNYGMLPQTWEDPEHRSEELGGIAVSTTVGIWALHCRHCPP